MEQKNSKFTPIRLPKPDNTIRRKMYANSQIMHVYYQVRNGVKKLIVDFIVAEGKYKGFKLSTGFYDSFKSRLRLGHLCSAVGVSGELKSPDQLIGKRVKLRVVPSVHNYMGKSYMNYRITRFHPIAHK
ncbi:hypothetical protein KAT51_08705 [bacterium]|nr:hypothetical protein [bacterium]